MSYSLNSLRVGHIGDCEGNYNRGLLRGNSRSLDYRTYRDIRETCRDPSEMM